jgi:cytochrome c553
MFDLPGVLILAALSIMFTLAARRAWKAKNTILKYGGMSVTCLLALIPTILLILALIGFARLNKKYDNPIVEMEVAGTAAQIARGQKLAHICANCHALQGQLPLSGLNLVTHLGLPPLGTLYAPNLTPAGNINDWTDGELIRAIREGVHKNGRSLLVMPSGIFRNLSDEDVKALVAYLRSQPATGKPTPDNQFNLVGALFMNLNDFRTAQAPVGSVTAPAQGTLEYGRYMVDIIGCRSCHGRQLQGRVDDGKPGPPPGPNLTRIIPQWTEEQFMTLFNTGELPGGGTVPLLSLPDGYQEPRMPWHWIRAMTTDEELKAIYAYLQSLPHIPGPAE